MYYKLYTKKREKEADPLSRSTSEEDDGEEGGNKTIFETSLFPPLPG